MCRIYLVSLAAKWSVKGVSNTTFQRKTRRSSIRFWTFVVAQNRWKWKWNMVKLRFLSRYTSGDWIASLQTAQTASVKTGWNNPNAGLSASTIALLCAGDFVDKVAKIWTFPYMKMSPFFWFMSIKSLHFQTFLAFRNCWSWMITPYANEQAL